ncbi:MAG: hypothetical protein NVSMB6_11400 [Burkholderiaceae bacterium]
MFIRISRPARHFIGINPAKIMRLERDKRSDRHSSVEVVASVTSGGSAEPGERPIPGLFAFVHDSIMILGLAAIGALALMFVRPDFSDHIKAWSPFASTTSSMQHGHIALDTSNGHDAKEEWARPGKSASEFAQNDIVEARRFGILQTPTVRVGTNEHIATILESKNLLLTSSHEQAMVTTWLARKYRLAGDAANMLVSAAYVTAKDIKLDPLLILSVVAIESGFNPFAESPLGAQGLMQVMSKIHQDKFQRLGGVKAALNPVANIKVGSSILKDYMTRGGSVEAGLKMYVGASAFDTDAGYGSKVMAEYRRLKEVSIGRKVPLTTNTVSSYTAKPKVPTQQSEITPTLPGTANPIVAPTHEPIAEPDASMAAL